MTDLRQTLEQLLEALERAGSPIPGLLQPGLPTERIAELTADLPFRLPDDVVALYEWRDGLTGRGASDQELFPEGFWLSLEEAVQMRRQAVQTAEWVAARAGLDPRESWDPSWLPTFVDFAANTFVVVCDRPAASPVWFVAGEDPDDRHLAYDSVESLARTAAECWDEGVFHVRSSGVEADDVRFAEIQRKHNPVAAARPT